MPGASVLVSIIVPMFNAERYISAALSSISRERLVPLEIIVVNDCSTDRSVDVVQAFSDPRIRLIEGPGRGVSAAMNVGLAATCGSIIMWCDADDCYPEGRIASQVEWLQEHTEYDALCGGFCSIDQNGNFIASFNCGESETEITNELRDGNLRTSYCTYAMRSALLQKVGVFREFFVTAQDIDFQLRLGELGRVYYQAENRYLYRIHSSSLTHTQPTRMREFFEAMAYRFHRQRRAGKLDDLQLDRVIENVPEDKAQPYSAALHTQELLMGQAWREHAAGKRWKATKIGVRAVARYPLRLSSWKSALALVIKPRTGKV